jgi:hypothetical protein
MLVESVLWSFIDCNIPPIAISDILGRSIPHDVSVRMSLSIIENVQDTLKVLEKLLEDAPRIICLLVEVGSNSLYLTSCLQEMVERAKPKLKSLRVLVFSCPFNTYAPVDVDCLFLHGGPRRLTQLSLVNSPIDWRRLEAFPLTKLHIDGVVHPIDWRSILSHLAPFLQDFLLHTNRGPKGALGAFEHLPRIHLAQIQQFNLKATPYSFCDLMSYLRLSVSAGIVLESFRPGTYERQALLVSLAQIFNQPFSYAAAPENVNIQFRCGEFTVRYTVGSGGGLMLGGHGYRADWEVFVSQLEPTVRARMRNLDIHTLGKDPLRYSTLLSMFPNVSNDDVARPFGSSEV